MQAIFQAHQYLLVREAAQHVRLSQGYVTQDLSSAGYTSDTCAVSDVFHTGSPETPLWEFRHGNGNFKRGDLNGLREIKRRASRHALIHRDSFSGASRSSTSAQPPPSIDHAQPMPDPMETRLSILEWNFNDLHGRFNRTEDAYHAMTAKCYTFLDGLLRCHQWTRELSLQISTLVPDPDHAIHRGAVSMRRDIERQIEQLKTLETPSEPSLFSNRQSLFSTRASQSTQGEVPAPPLSPRQRVFDDSRRPSLQSITPASSLKTNLSQHVQSSPGRYGSIGSTHPSSASSVRPTHLPPPPPAPPLPPSPYQHPPLVASSAANNLARRHTTADIRVQGWNVPLHSNTSPYDSPGPVGFPSSPRHNSISEQQQIRDVFASYELAPRRHPRLGSPPVAPSGAPDAPAVPYASPSSDGWHFSAPGNMANLAPGPTSWRKRGSTGDGDGPPPASSTRRSSAASNVHSLLNPTDTAERREEDSIGGIFGEGAKRKRIM